MKAKIILAALVAGATIFAPALFAQQQSGRMLGERPAQNAPMTTDLLYQRISNIQDQGVRSQVQTIADNLVKLANAGEEYSGSARARVNDITMKLADLGAARRVVGGNQDALGGHAILDCGSAGGHGVNLCRVNVATLEITHLSSNPKGTIYGAYGAAESTGAGYSTGLYRGHQ